ncbi:FAD-dependent pyridine nucleotide-disulfide oxidoreductase [Sulfurimonas gotlandica GD1]|uniref:FAD-dependent pyridine nucleotide-disulfide oxidoreductase n=1 Tax=Sulfurimonas gotlandica (strain DSM 19862 / JCM 16533 / GD1) TaxID=929558 RepID=B6BNH4_SULGG|nr:TIGR03862 family flavoprotein [Sulfurimonas gotlandica]EDZ61397.1 pyridine nucleotide-disulfide oxidoreductase [Sulfurimonas gotlandica GD1]EHP31045.1 FAD-dependent pyridine nucleotide-disulfide oxidoreductase [Sulfurimonas gotlandica GD1]
MIAIIGAGPAGLMAAQVLSEAGYAPTVFDAMPSAARKFLIAGRGGLNLTHAEDFDLFASRYFEAQAFLQPALETFSPNDMRLWAESLGFETFVGSSGKVYPLDKKAAPLLRTWIHKLKANGTQFKMKHRWVGWSNDVWQFETPDGLKDYSFDAVILALGGASLPHLGSTGAWTTILKDKGLEIAPLKPANMGFNVNWSKVFKEKFSGTPLKNVELSFRDINENLQSKLGELLVNEYGVEGSLIYTHSKYLREQIEQKSPFRVYLDLFPHRSESQLKQQLSAKQGKQSLSAFWKRLGLDGVKASLLREVLAKELLSEPELVAKTLKKFPLSLESYRPIEEAISTAGGLAFENLDEHLMLKDFPRVFCVGEMLNWEAPTGGYLLTGVMGQGKQAAQGLLKLLQRE